MKPIYRHITPLLERGSSRWATALGFLGFVFGLSLLLLCVQLFFDMQTMLSARGNSRKDYISISKTISNDDMGGDNTFARADIEKLLAHPNIVAVSPLIPALYSVHASAGSLIPFSTDLFLESVDHQALDSLPPEFQWHRGETMVPVILSADFLELYNVFAPAQGLPQISPKTLQSVGLILRCEGPGGSATFRARIVGLSDRIQSVLVPMQFMRWSNGALAGVDSVKPSRVFLKVEDAGSKNFIAYLQKQGFHLNTEKYKYARLKGVLQGVFGGLGLMGGFILLMAFLVFVFIIRLALEKSRTTLRLLLTLGYPDSLLRKAVARKFLPQYLLITICSLVVAQIAHALLVQQVAVAVTVLLHPLVFVLAAFFFLMLMVVNRVVIRAALQRM